jgi:acylphosphatase
VIRRRVVVRGRVQGVNFRAATRRAAQSRGIAGWVTNRDDGAVEAVLEGDEATVEGLIEGLRRGPPAAQVEDLDVTAEEPENLTTFEIR